jgi:hypothetical protein
VSLGKHRSFLQHDRSPHEREGGLHGVLSALFPVQRLDPRVDLDYRSYELVESDGALVLYVSWRLAFWMPDGSIGSAVEEPVMVCLILPSADEAYEQTSEVLGAGESIEHFSSHLSALVGRMAATARNRIAQATPTTAPSDLLVAGS